VTSFHSSFGARPISAHGIVALTSRRPSWSSRAMAKAVTSLLTLATTIGESGVARLPSIVVPDARLTITTPSRITVIDAAALLRAKTSKAVLASGIAGLGTAPTGSVVIVGDTAVVVCAAGGEATVVLIVGAVVVDGGVVLVVVVAAAAVEGATLDVGDAVGVGRRGVVAAVSVVVVVDAGAEIVAASPHAAKANALKIAHAISGRRRPEYTAEG
jgi:hypothetical protein